MPNKSILFHFMEYKPNNVVISKKRFYRLFVSDFIMSTYGGVIKKKNFMFVMFTN